MIQTKQEIAAVGNALAATKPNAPPAVLNDLFKRDAGKGVSVLQEDNLVPLIYVLQPLSPQVDKRNRGAYIEGAEPGDIWLRNSPDPIVRGEDGFLFQPCYFYKDWVEWVPRDSGGGFVSKYDALPEVADKHEDPKNKNKITYLMPNGNQIIETRYHVGYAILPNGAAFPYVLPLASTGHTFSRQWMFMMNSKRVDGEIPPSWSCLYHIKTKQRTNAAGTWFTLEASDGGWVSTAVEYQRGFDLFNAFSRGEKKIETPLQEHVGTDEAPF